MFSKLKMKEKILFKEFDANKTYTSLMSNLNVKPYKQQKEFKELVLFLEKNGYNIEVKKNGNKVKTLSFKFPLANDLSLKLFSDQYNYLKYQIFQELAITLKKLGFRNIEFHHCME